ncbi:hypothetical protein CC1G_15104 [Coprinopsis cinerea okayama7|uniref:Uncharacterized protein n=1 Tax=Coprinopsis cinerea (strain Okayama-7 / 130 / ATCC MYA-4618 / FGSC 9003) TaxID=240176 RepID=D6RPG6_COPC7|nr:hypothetical protein CC1G_15104 [Coprinopsis cinerea okayama7\|eukprot:XP_002910463.1 hypothetical protein CC1G_15104 [Coprinopsis cinerea okayama7\
MPVAHNPTSRAKSTREARLATDSAMEGTFTLGKDLDVCSDDKLSLLRSCGNIIRFWFNRRIRLHGGELSPRGRRDFDVFPSNDWDPHTSTVV